MHALLLTGDLLFSSQLHSAAARQGWQMTQLPSVQALMEYGGQEPADLLVLDLTMLVDTAQWDAAFARAQALGCPVLAYAPHVQRQRLAAARQRHCRWVLTRGQLHGQAESLFRDFRGFQADGGESGEPPPPAS